jgi:hypothetical protein
MAKRIFLESRNVFGSGMGHMYLVFREEGAATDDDNDHVIAGEPNYLGLIPIGTRIVVFAGVAIGTTNGDKYNGATAQSRFSLDITDRVTSGGVAENVQAAWTAMVAAANGIRDARYNYELPGPPHVANSGALILSALNAVGVDVRDLPRHDGQQGTTYLAPGAIAPAGFPTSFPGASNSSQPTLLGTAGNVNIIASTNQKSGLLILGRDTFADGVIDAKDAAFARLRIWRDLEQNGATDAGELPLMIRRAA